MLGCRFRDELQAAHTQDDRVLLRRPLSTRRGWDTESPGIRPGILRQERRWFGRLETARPPLQVPGVPVGRLSGRARRNPHTAADYRYVFARAVSRGVL